MVVIGLNGSRITAFIDSLLNLINMEVSKYPRVLLLGHQFDNRTGLGITLSNLFANWPKENISIMAHQIDVDMCEQSRPCANYIGKIVHKQIKSSRKIYFVSKLRQLIRNFYYYAGLHELMYKFNYSSREINSAKKIDPDILFCCLGSLNSMKDCIRLKSELPKTKLVLYIVDDWVNTKENNRLFPSYWRNQNNIFFRDLLGKSSGLLSICQAMSDEYKNHYGYNFIPFHNPVDMMKWNNVKRDLKYSQDITSILYVGKINDDTRQCLKSVARVVNKLNQNNGRFVFDVYTPDYSKNQELFLNFSGCHIFKPLQHNEIPALTKGYTALLLALGFSRKTREYVRLSMPTKLSEYLASGIPIILYCPSEIALAKYLTPFNCVIPCFTDDENELNNAIKKLDDDKLCSHISKLALEVAEQHEINKVRDRFLSSMINFIS